MRGSRSHLLVGGVVALALATADAQTPDSKSAQFAKELAHAMDQAKLDSVAAKDPAAPDQFVAALYFSGAQLLVVSAKYSVPVLLEKKLESREYRDIYIDLNSASIPTSKVFIQDLGVDGLKAKPEDNQPFDTYEAPQTQVAFDGDWRKQKLSEDQYMKTFGLADDQYSKMLQLLLAQAKKPS